MSLPERFYDILTTGDLEAAGDSNGRLVFGVILRELLEAVCAERGHDWSKELLNDGAKSWYEITGPCCICGEEKP